MKGIQKIRNQKNTGLALTESLVAMLILTIGMTGFLEMQRRALWDAVDSHKNVMADILLYDGVERVRANPQDALTYGQNTAGSIQIKDPNNGTLNFERSAFYRTPTIWGSANNANCWSSSTTLDQRCVPNHMAGLELANWQAATTFYLNTTAGQSRICHSWNGFTSGDETLAQNPTIACGDNDTAINYTRINRYIDFGQAINAGVEVGKAIPNYTVKFQWNDMSGVTQTRVTRVTLPALRLDSHRD